MSSATSADVGETVSMANLLYLVHRLPYPPNKGDKVRSFHLLKHLAARHRVFLGTFVDDADDLQHVATVAPYCAGLHAARLHPRRARLASLGGLVRGGSLSRRYYADAGLARWVAHTAQAEAIDAVVVFSSSMAQYAEGLADVPLLVDFVDVDSAKWQAYADARSGPLAWLYRTEARRLLTEERAIAARARRSFFVTAQEAALFARLAPDCAARIEPMNNGVDADFFAPDACRPSPFGAHETALVFTGAMDYWPNVDAVTWFAAEVLPTLRAAWPQLRLHVVGRSPAAEVTALADDTVVVTGTVLDVRPWLQYARVVVAPLRTARGIQNKVLEAMAMGRPVVVSQACAEAVDAEPGRELVAAVDAPAFAAAVDALLRAPAEAERIGAAARRRVVQRYGWAAHLAGIDRHLPEGRSDAAGVRAPGSAVAGAPSVASVAPNAAGAPRVGAPV
jgi:polysaccharide biosynthesis protein PslH